MNVAIRKGKRSSSYVEYVEPFERVRNTLTVIRYANVSEVHFLKYKWRTNQVCQTIYFCRFCWIRRTKLTESHILGTDSHKLLMRIKKLF